MRKVLPGTPEGSTIRELLSCRSVTCICTGFPTETQMGVNMTKELEGVNVYTMKSAHRRGPVLYAALPCETHDSQSRQLLVSTLLNHLVEKGSPLSNRCQASKRAASPIQVVRDLLGKPYLLLGGSRGPAISFSEGGGKVWAALSGDESDIGIDVAGTDEFQRIPLSPGL